MDAQIAGGLKTLPLWKAKENVTLPVNFDSEFMPLQCASSETCYIIDFYFLMSNPSKNWQKEKNDYLNYKPILRKQ